jgi:hypothetical protein
MVKDKMAVPRRIIIVGIILFFLKEIIIVIRPIMTEKMILKLILKPDGFNLI